MSPDHEPLAQQFLGALGIDVFNQDLSRALGQRPTLRGEGEPTRDR